MRFLTTIFVMLSLMIGVSSNHAQTSSPLIEPENLAYVGAFRLPEGTLRPDTFEYGGGAMTFNPDGDPLGANDGFAGSLFVMGHDRLAYGEMPDGNRVAEITIPVPLQTPDINALNRAKYLQPLTDVAAGYFTGLDEIPRVGIEYLNHPLTGALLHITWGQHFQPDVAAPSQGWFSPNLAQANMQGSWFVSPQTPYSTNDYLFEIPAEWADTYVDGQYLATGRYRDGGWSGMGPALFAYRPWLDDGSAPPADTELAATPLLLYENTYNQADIVQSMTGYQHPDEWNGGAWLTTTDGRSAVIFVGTKSVGAKYWYGWVNPAGADLPCVETELLDDFTLCRLADGSACPAEDFLGCDGHNDYRGWWSSDFAAQMIFYNPDDLAQVAQGSRAPYEPQPYATLTIDPYLYHNPENVEGAMLGTGRQQRGRIGASAFDRAHGLLYVLELFADSAQPVVHVWQID